MSEKRAEAEAGNADLPIGPTTRSAAKPADQEIGVPGASAPIWHHEYWDRSTRNEAHFPKALDYIHQNPVVAKLVARPQDWLWGSARHMPEIPVAD